MHCSRCGNRVQLGDKFCERCGIKLENQLSTHSDSLEINGTNKRKKHQRIVIIIVAIFVLIGLVFGGWFGWGWYQNFLTERHRKEAQVIAQKKQGELEEKILHPTAFINIPIRYGNWEISVRRAQFKEAAHGRYYSSFFGRYLEHYPDGVYYQIDVNVKNIAQATDNFSFGDENFVLVNENGAQYQIKTDLFSANGRLDIGPEFEKVGTLFYDIPTGDHQYRLLIRNQVAISLSDYLGIGLERNFGLGDDDEYHENVVHYVFPSSSSEKEGIKKGDHIVSINNNLLNPETSSPHDWYDIYRQIGGTSEDLIGKEVALEVKRGDSTLTVRPNLEKLPTNKYVYTREDVIKYNDNIWDY